MWRRGKKWWSSSTRAKRSGGQRSGHMEHACHGADALEAMERGHRTIHQKLKDSKQQEGIPADSRAIYSTATGL
jgi:hypothetical protein